MRKQFYEIVNKYLPNWDLNPIEEAGIYYQYEKMNGKEGIKALIGFVQYAEKEDNDLSEIQISGTLGHDINGALREDELLSPRSTSYGKFYKGE